MRLIPTTFEMCRIREAILSAINFENESHKFCDIEVNLHKDIVCVVDALVTCWESNEITKNKIEITDAVAVDIYNREFKIDIISQKL